jgi:uncharacterized protein
MGRMVFVNLPVRDARAARDFWTALGFEINEMFSDATTVSVVVEEGSIVLMLLEEARFRDFITTEIADAHAVKEVLTALSCDSKEEVDDLLHKALAAGAKPWKPVMDAPPMYGASFQDPDGHVFELVHMDLSGLPAN